MTMPPTSGYAPVVSEGRPARPTSVTIAGYLLFVLAAMQIISFLISLSTFGVMRDVFADVYKGTEMEGSEDLIVTVTIAITAGVVLLFSIGFVVLGILDLKGKQPARIITWVVAGLLLCCSGANLAGSGVGSSFGGSTNGVDAAEVQRRISEATPDWVQPVTLTVGLIQLLLAIAVVVLLALPSSHPFFRKPAPQEWTPPAYPSV